MLNPARSASATPSIRVLLVEDVEDEAFLLFSELQSRGLRIDYQRVDTAAEMRAALDGQDWELVISDHDMPGFDSLAALRVLQEAGKDVPFIIYSGRITDQQAVSAMHDGVHDYIEKGNYARLMPVIERELRSAETRRAMREADGRIQELSFYDALSNLPNSHSFCTQLNERILASEPDGGPLRGHVIYLDLDRFMRINSSFGYETGDEILRQVARRLAAALPERGMLARSSGDAFVAFEPLGSEGASIEATLAAIRGVFELPFHKGLVELFIAASIGVTRLPEDGSEAHELLMQAETAMSHARLHGGNRAEFFHREMNESHSDRMALETDLRHAIERGELFLQYQPCVAAGDGHIVGVEALLGWRHPRRGLIPADRYVPIADESGAIVEIGEWVLREACRQGRAWQESGFAPYVSINVSAVQFAQPRLLEDVGLALAETGFPPDRLQLEITESVLMQDAESAVGMLRAFKHMGVRIAVDDFGTGYSSLAYLKRLPLDILKIDRSFVRDLARSEDDRAIVRAVVTLARNLRLSTVGEGVETVEQAEFLRSEGCDRLQGFLYGCAMDAASIGRRLAEEQDRG